MKRTIMVMLFLIASITVFSQTQEVLDFRKTYKESYEEALEEYSFLMVAIVSFEYNTLVITISYKMDTDITPKESFDDSMDELSNDEKTLLRLMMKTEYMKIIKVDIYGRRTIYKGKI